MAVSRSALRGVRYAFGRGMDPRKKDGVRAHPFVLAAGLLLHAGIATALLILLVRLLALDLPPRVLIATAGVQGAAALAGLGLLVRRLREPVLQAISVADDYVSNILAVTLLVTGASSILFPGSSWFFVSTALVLAAYAPFGKIRHCVLFFVTRARFGAFVGTRGVLDRRVHG